jgi:hypothetical protein
VTNGGRSHGFPFSEQPCRTRKEAAAIPIPSRDWLSSGHPLKAKRRRPSLSNRLTTIGSLERCANRQLNDGLIAIQVVGLPWSVIPKPLWLTKKSLSRVALSLLTAFLAGNEIGLVTP